LKRIWQPLPLNNAKRLASNIARPNSAMPKMSKAKGTKIIANSTAVAPPLQRRKLMIIEALDRVAEKGMLLNSNHC
jgi:hypothetical protein